MKELLIELAQYQKRLDEKIHHKFELLDSDTVDKRIFASIVELCEFANEETKNVDVADDDRWKYWALKRTENYNKMLEEYIDVLHFLLSLANSANVNIMWETSILYRPTLLDYMFDFIGDMVAYKISARKIHLSGAIWIFIYIGQLLGFTKQEIKEAYIEKHTKNVDRLERGY